MLKIRLMRIGAKKKPFYRVVVVDERAKRTGAYIELLGTYNPLTEPKDIKLKQDRIDYWVKQGAQPSTGYLRIIGKAPQRPPRKPKKEKKQIEPKVTEAAKESTAEESTRPEEQVKEEVQNNSENSENQKVGGSEKPESQTSETPVSSDSSDTSGAPSHSGVSEKIGEVSNERSA